MGLLQREGVLSVVVCMLTIFWFMCCQADAEEFLKVVADVNAKAEAKVEEVDADLMREFAYSSSGDICPMQAFIGGITAQEVMKVCMHNCTILSQSTLVERRMFLNPFFFFFCKTFNIV